jgi:hypothetical protein
MAAKMTNCGDTTSWKPVRRACTTAPSGRLDEFMVRNSINPNRGVIMFTNGTGSTRLAVVELRGGERVCLQIYGW